MFEWNILTFFLRQHQRDTFDGRFLRDLHQGDTSPAEQDQCAIRHEETHKRKAHLLNTQLKLNKSFDIIVCLPSIWSVTRACFSSDYVAALISEADGVRKDAASHEELLDVHIQSSVGPSFTSCFSLRLSRSKLQLQENSDARSGQQTR